MTRLIYPKILSFYIGRCLGINYKALAIAKLSDGTLRYDTVNLEPK